MSEGNTERARRSGRVGRASGHRALSLVAWGILLVGGWAVTTTCASYQLYSDCFTSTSQCDAGPDDPDAGPDVQDAVLFLIGDAGAHEFEDNPVLQHLKTSVAEFDARGVPTTVVFLGDNVYEEGLREDHPEDLRLLAAQVEVVVGTSARGIFVPGNHDWDDQPNDEGLARLMNQERALQDFNADGIDVTLIPRAGCPGPRRELLEGSDGVVRAALIVLDTPWWMLEPPTPARCGPSTKQAVMQGVARTVVEEPGLPIIVAAHHPMMSGGPHAGNANWLRSVGNWFGLLPNDFSSPQYREFITSMTEAFAQVEGPVIYVAGHDHSLQVIDGVADAGSGVANAASVLHLVSGSGSKVTGAGPIPGSRFAAGLPGYMRLDLGSEGGIRLSVIAECSADAVDANLCPPGEAGRFESVYRMRVR